MGIKIMNDLIEEIEVTTNEYIDLKLETEMKEAKMWLETDWAVALNKAKPTQKDKEYYIKQQLNGDKKALEHIRAIIDSLKRKYEVKLLEYKFSLEGKEGA